MGLYHHIPAHMYRMFIIFSITILVLFGCSADVPSNTKKESNSSKVTGCLSRCQKYLLISYHNRHYSLSGPGLQHFLAEELYSLDSCRGSIGDTNSLLKLSVLHRRLIGEGSHRRLLSFVKFENLLDPKFVLFAKSCEAIIIEVLPSGVFVDPFELQHLVQRGVYHDAAVFGDTNLELPSAHSNQSAVEVHLDISQNVISKQEKGFEISIELPIHARYPPLDGNGGGYSNVEMSLPELMMHCRMGNEQGEHCLWMSILGEKETMSVEQPIWQIPCGNNMHAGFVSLITFLSAFTSLLVIVVSAIFYSKQTNDAITKD